VAEGNRTTLLVAVAGIAATALVGIAGTAAAWLSARDDREAQRELARDERTYDRRVSAYLDAIDFVEAQKMSLDRWLDTNCSERLCDSSEDGGPRIPYEPVPPPRLISRLRAFGSAQVFRAFQKTQSLVEKMPITYGPHYIQAPPFPYVDVGPTAAQPDPDFLRAHEAFAKQIVRFETIVHDEVG
jgi:hypothetical protein